MDHASHIGRLFERPSFDPRSVCVAAGIVGAGGTGKSELLGALAARWEEAGHDVRRLAGRRLEREAPFGGLNGILTTREVASLAQGDAQRSAARAVDLALSRLAEGVVLVVDDGQWLDPGSLRALVGLAERNDRVGSGVVVGHRPAAGVAGMATLDAALSRREPLVTLGPLAEPAVQERLATIIGRAPHPTLVDEVMLSTGGVPAYVQSLATGWVAEGLIENGRLRAAPTLPPSILERVRAEVDQLEAGARSLLVAFSFGPPTGDDLLGAVAGVDPGALGDTIEALRAAGLVAQKGDDVIPVVAEAIEALSPSGARRRYHAGLARELARRQASPVEVAEHVVAAGLSGPRAAERLVAAGERSLGESPSLALGWYRQAVAAGADPLSIAARRAEAAMLAGDAARALRFADAVLSARRAPGRGRALSAAGAALAARGRWARSADAYRTVAGRASAAAKPVFLALEAIGLTASGELEAAREAVATDATGGASGPLVGQAARFTARGFLESLVGWGEGALTTLLEGADLLESARPPHLIPETPHALAATIAIVSREQALAQDVLTRALGSEVGGPPFVARHRLLLGWAGLVAGDWQTAGGRLAEARGGPPHPLPLRDTLLAAALEVGIARRSGNVEALRTAWAAAQPAAVAHPIDLLAMPAFGELAAGAARLGHRDRAAAWSGAVGALLSRLGDPPLWSLWAAWSDLQTAVATGQASDIASAAQAVAGALPAPPGLASLPAAAKAWAGVVRGRLDAAGVERAAASLHASGLPWEAARLVGTAAIRATDPEARRLLLRRARELRVVPATEPAAAAPPAAALSPREMDVAAGVVAGLTHKEIGAQLFISPKTVEHHVARIRQKLGTATRAELLAAMREHLGTG